MFKNVAGQKITFYVVDASTGLPKTGDAANITAYVSKDDGAVTVLADTSATEADSTNAKGDYLFDLAQAETNGDKLRFGGKSTTANVVVMPQTIYTLPATGILAPATAGQTLAVDAAGGVTLADGVAHGGTAGGSTATLSLQRLDVRNPSGTAVTMLSNGGNGTGLRVAGSGSGYGVQVAAESNDGVLIQVDEGGAGVRVVGGGPAVVLNGYGGDHDIHLTGSGYIWDGVNSKPVSVRLADATDHGGTLGSSTATLALKQLRLRSDGSVPALHVEALSTGGTAGAASFTAQGADAAVKIQNTNDGPGLLVQGAADQEGAILAGGAGGGTGLYVTGDNSAAYFFAAGGTEAAVVMDGSGGTGPGLDAVLSAATLSGIFYTAMTESYAADGAAATLAQMFYMLWSALCQADVTGTTISCKKLDGTTESMVFTLDDAALPTSRVRSG